MGRIKFFVSNRHPNTQLSLDSTSPAPTPQAPPAPVRAHESHSLSDTYSPQEAPTLQDELSLLFKDISAIDLEKILKDMKGGNKIKREKEEVEVKVELTRYIHPCLYVCELCGAKMEKPYKSNSPEPTIIEFKQKGTCSLCSTRLLSWNQVDLVDMLIKTFNELTKRRSCL